MRKTCLYLLVLTTWALSACIPENGDAVPVATGPTGTPTPSISTPEVTPLPTREPYPPGTLVDYTVQTGDTLDALAARFNSSVDEIRQANPIIPKDVTILPPGMPMKIPIYYLPLWGTPYQIIPDALFVDGPAEVGFDTAAFINTHPGWLREAREATSQDTIPAYQIIDTVARDYSVSPRLLLALLEYQAGALTQPVRPAGTADYVLGYHYWAYKGFYNQLIWAANTLNNAYYTYRQGALTSFDHLDGSLERFDPWQNAATAALQYFYSRIEDGDAYQQAVSGAGLANAYKSLFGDPWKGISPHLPGNLRQPDFILPFQPNKYWAFTGGPHTGWGEGQPLAAIDFAPPSVVGGCAPSDEWATAVADGVIARAEPGVAVLDLDGDGDERTGWTILYLHTILADGIIKGKPVKTGDLIGRPSCETGKATGTHLHIARKFNGEWILADGPIAFNLEGWIAHAGSEEYQGTLTKLGRTITACLCSDRSSQLRLGE